MDLPRFSEIFPKISGIWSRFLTNQKRNFWEILWVCQRYLHTFVFSTSREHWTEFTVKSFGESHQSHMLRVAWLLAVKALHPPQKSMSVSAELTTAVQHNCWTTTRLCSVNTPLQSLHMKWIGSCSRVDENVTMGSCRIKLCFSGHFGTACILWTRSSAWTWSVFYCAWTRWN